MKTFTYFFLPVVMLPVVAAGFLFGVFRLFFTIGALFARDMLVELGQEEGGE